MQVTVVVPVSAEVLVAVVEVVVNSVMVAVVGMVAVVLTVTVGSMYDKQKALARTMLSFLRRLRKTSSALQALEEGKGLSVSYRIVVAHRGLAYSRTPSLEGQHHAW